MYVMYSTYAGQQSNESIENRNRQNGAINHRESVILQLFVSFIFLFSVCVFMRFFFLSYAYVRRR